MNKNTVEITVKMTDDNGKVIEQKYVFDQAQINNERGIKIVCDEQDNVLRFDSNNQKRIMIKAWSGCSSFDDFVAQEK